MNKLISESIVREIVLQHICQDKKWSFFGSYRENKMDWGIGQQICSRCGEKLPITLDDMKISGLISNLKYEK